MKIDCVVIGAAGMGTRLNHKVPKALVSIRNGKKIIDYQMEMLKNINDIRIVVGYKAKELSAHIRNNYPDVEIVYNNSYKTTSICYSLYLATKDLNKPYVAMCSDLLINKEEFNNFLNSFNDEPLLGITYSKTEDSIYASINSDKVVSFQRNSPSNYEWANIACVCEPIKINKNATTMFSQFEKYFPLKYFLFDNCFEIDTNNDLQFALENLNKL